MSEFSPSYDTTRQRLAAMHAALPKISEDDPRIVAHKAGEEKYSHHQFGNNFYLLFLAIARGENGIDDGTLWRVYVDRFQNQPNVASVMRTQPFKDVMSFMQSDTWRNHEEFSYAFTDATNQATVIRDTEERRRLYDSFLESCGGRIGLWMENAYTWDQLNELLVANAEVFAANGIDPEQFYG